MKFLISSLACSQIWLKSSCRWYASAISTFLIFNSLIWWLKEWVIYPERNNRKKKSLMKTKDNFFLFFISWYDLKTDRKQLTLKETQKAGIIVKDHFCVWQQVLLLLIGLESYFILFSFLFFLNDFCSLFKIRIWIGVFCFFFSWTFFLGSNFIHFSKTNNDLGLINPK